MINILSAISGQFGKALIMGTFFPVTAFVTLLLLFAVPLMPAGLPFLKPLQDLDTTWKVVTFLFVTIVMTGLLYNLNTPLIRFYEGYLWLSSSVGRRRVATYKAKRDHLAVHGTGMRTLLRALQSDPSYADDPRYNTILTHWIAITLEIGGSFPGRPDLVLPTRLGNTIRSFEHYSEQEYGMDSIALWPRLIAKIDKEYAATVGDAKISFDFMLNSSFLATLLAVVLFVLGVRYPLSLVNSYEWARWTLAIVGFAGLAYLFYLATISQAAAWGALVKGAFDLYRNGLLEQLGYKHRPQTRLAERVLWNKISRQILFGDSPDGPRADYAEPAPTTPRTYARGTPGGPELTVVRGVSQIESDGTITILLSATNADGNACVKDLVIADTLPDGFEYVWDSAASDGRNVAVSGTNPYRFEVGDLAPGTSVVVSYRAVPRRGPDLDGRSATSSGNAVGQQGEQT